MTSLKTPFLTIQLNNQLQTDEKQQRIFKYTGLKRHAKFPEKWIESARTFRSVWVYCIRYIDNDELVGFQFGYDNEYCETLSSDEMTLFWKP